MIELPFMQNALLAATAVAAVAGPVGYLLLLRGQLFGADALSHSAFTGGLAAVALGIDVRLGVALACVAVALTFVGPRTGRDAGPGVGREGLAGEGDVTIGAVFAGVLGLGVLLLARYTSGDPGSAGGSAGSASGAGGVRVLFGSVLGLSRSEAVSTAVACALIGLVLLVIARPAVFAGWQPQVAAARGVPVRGLGMVVLVLAGAVVAVATPVVGALLVLGLLAAPAGAVALCCPRPGSALPLAAAVAVASVWAGLALTWVVPWLPAGAGVVLAAALAFAAAAALATAKGRGPVT